jgi:hypothetical protein
MFALFRAMPAPSRSFDSEDNGIFLSRSPARWNLGGTTRACPSRGRGRVGAPRNMQGRLLIVLGVALTLWASACSNDTDCPDNDAGDHTKRARDGGATVGSGTSRSEQDAGVAPSEGSPSVVDSEDASPDSGALGCGVPTAFAWTSTGPLIAPASDATHKLIAVKNPTVFFFDDRWNIYASTVDTNRTYASAYMSFTDWPSAGSAPQTYLSGGVAPQVFYFAPQKLWYRVYEWPGVYDTTQTPTQPESWSQKKAFYSSEPAIVTQNKGSHGWLDFWVICDDANCFLFFSDDNGHLYRAQTGIGDFPNGFGEPVIVLSDPTPERLFEASTVYSMQGTGRYLLLVEAFDTASARRRYFRSWTATALDGAWTPLQGEYASPFASAKNVTFEGDAWTADFSHGEMLRAGYDQKLEIDPCRLRYVYQGKDPGASGDYNSLPWRLGLLTAK